MAALRTAALPKALDWLGVAIGAAGVLSVVPVLQDLKYGFGLLQIAWFVWLGIAMLRAPARAASPAMERPAPLQTAMSTLPRA